MKKILSLALIALISTTAIAKTQVVNVTPTSTQNSQENYWRFSQPQHVDAIKVFNYTSHPIEVAFKVYPEIQKGDVTVVRADKVNVECNYTEFTLAGGQSIFCEIKPGSQFHAYISKENLKNGAEGTYQVR